MNCCFCDTNRSSPSRIPRPLVLGLVAIAWLAPSVGAQARRRADLSEFQGVYAYHGSTSLAIVAADSIIFAVIDEAKYPTTAAAVRAVTRPSGPDGRPVSYVYRAPADRSDGLCVGNLIDAGFDTTTVTRLVNRVVDGTYPDVHNLLVYRGGKVVVEEYFYGYDRERSHQMRSASKSVVSALVGIAIDRGVLGSDTELVTTHLPYASYASPDPRKDRLILRDLLTMRSELACDDWNAASPRQRVARLSVSRLGEVRTRLAAHGRAGDRRSLLLRQRGGRGTHRRARDRRVAACLRAGELQHELARHDDHGEGPVAVNHTSPL